MKCCENMRNQSFKWKRIYGKTKTEWWLYHLLFNTTVICIRSFVFFKCFQIWCPRIFSKPCRTIGIRHLILQPVNVKEKENGLSSRRCLKVWLIDSYLTLRAHLIHWALLFFHSFSWRRRPASQRISWSSNKYSHWCS